MFLLVDNISLVFLSFTARVHISILAFYCTKNTLFRFSLECAFNMVGSKPYAQPSFILKGSEITASKLHFVSMQLLLLSRSETLNFLDFNFLNFNVTFIYRNLVRESYRRTSIF